MSGTFGTGRYENVILELIRISCYLCSFLFLMEQVSVDLRFLTPVQYDPCVDFFSFLNISVYSPGLGSLSFVRRICLMWFFSPSYKWDPLLNPEK